MANFLDQPKDKPELRNHIPEIAQAQEAPPDTALADRDSLVAQIKNQAKEIEGLASTNKELQDELEKLRTSYATLSDEHERLLLAYNKEGETEAETANTEPPANTSKSGKKHR